MVKTTCNGTCEKDCWDCGKYFSAHSSHYDTYYNCRIVEFTCFIGGDRIFKDED